METNSDDALNRRLPSSDYTQFPSTSAVQKPRKKPTNKFAIPFSVTVSGHKPSARKPPDPAAPKITPPCTECGKKFWSVKALFGHMRCHPERQWRGINPPPNLRPVHLTEEDAEAAACLLMLANGPPAAADPESPSGCTVNQLPPATETTSMEYHYNCSSSLVNCGRFECSSCKKVFGSHQALGGHRASHKNVKGCYANTKKDAAESDIHHHGSTAVDDAAIVDDNGHKCSICFRVFTSGQALGGHMRCHWEKTDLQEPQTFRASHGFDLNLPPLQDKDDNESAAAVHSSAFPYDLNLRLGF